MVRIACVVFKGYLFTLLRFFEDFGPLCLSAVYRYRNLVNNKLKVSFSSDMLSLFLIRCPNDRLELEGIIVHKTDPVMHLGSEHDVPIS